MDIIKRKLLPELISHLDKEEITLIVGPRQAGKTTLMRELQRHLEQQGEQTLFLNLDIEEDRKHFVSQQRLLQKIHLELGAGRGFIFIDEIQRLQDAGMFLKGLYDMDIPYKLIVSGSGSVELKEKIHESMAGRKRMFELTTLSLEEFVNYKTLYKYEGKLKDFFSIEQEQGFLLLNEYLNFGGYPRVVLAEDAREKEAIISEIYSSYVEKDIVNLLGLKKSDVFIKLVTILASQVGQLVNIAELSRTLGVAYQTAREYLWYLEKTYIVRRMTPLSRNVRSELTKSPVYYFTDLGLRNMSLGLFGDIDLDVGKGFVFQNFIEHIVHAVAEQTSSTVHYWRTAGGAEVDFVWLEKQQPIPIEVKHMRMKKPTVSRSFRSFIRSYAPSLAVIVNLTFDDSLHIGDTLVRFIPYYLLKETLARKK